MIWTDIDDNGVRHPNEHFHQPIFNLINKEMQYICKECNKNES